MSNRRTELRWLRQPLYLGLDERVVDFKMTLQSREVGGGLWTHANGEAYSYSEWKDVPVVDERDISSRSE